MMRAFSYFSIIFFVIIFFASCKVGSTKSALINTTEVLRVTTRQNADSLERKAVKEFEKYFRKIYADKNIDLNVRISKSSDSLMDPHNLKYYVSDNILHIEGGNSMSTLYAVYEFLENEFGCRFLDPTLEKIPKQDQFVMKDWSYDYTPDITTRTVHSRLFYENPEFAAKHKVTELAFPRYVPKARVHTFQHLVPAEDYFESHPEYYALRNGKRRTTQLCLTNEEVYKIVLDSVRQFLKESPDSEVISVSQDDNTLYCQCTECEGIHQKEESAAGSMIYFVNRIAKAIPDKQISTLAYQYTRKAPKYIVPEENVLITLCSIECDRSASIEDKCEEFSNDLIEWGKISDNIRIWDYTTQFTNFLAPFPNLHTIHPNIKLFRDNNAKWIFEQHSRNPSELFELRSYLTAKLLWNPDYSADSIRNDFLTNYYEDAAPFVGSYIESIHSEIQKDSNFFLFLYGDPSQGFNSFLDQKNLEYYDGLFQKAETLVNANPELLSRIQRARLSIDYAGLEFYKTNLREFLEKDSEAIKDKLDRFKSTTDHGNITAMNEMRFTVQEYLNQYSQTLERAKESNIAYNNPVTLLSKPKKYAKEDPQVLTDGAYGGSSFFSNWLGFEGNDLEAVIDLGSTKKISAISSAFLQVTNHIVFLPTEVEYLGSTDGVNFVSIRKLICQNPLTKKSKINKIEYFNHSGNEHEVRYIKIKATNQSVAPEWHNSSGLPAWIFVDEVHVY